MFLSVATTTLSNGVNNMSIVQAGLSCLWFALLTACASTSTDKQQGINDYNLALSASKWQLIDDFEHTDSIAGWTQADTKNDTRPHIAHPQVTERRQASTTSGEITNSAFATNSYMLKKPAADGIVGNRKALTFKALPERVAVGETYTFYTRINVESFPNNHAFGLSDMGPADIKKHDYNAFEATLRVTDKTESNGHENTGVLMVKVPDGYANIKNIQHNRDAKPLVPGTWYQIWYVVNNASVAKGGQTYDVFVKGGDEFAQQTLVFQGATFRMQRARPLTHFLMNCNTGPVAKPYGNGGLKYDDLYMAKGVQLHTP